MKYFVLDKHTNPRSFFSEFESSAVFRREVVIDMPDRKTEPRNVTMRLRTCLTIAEKEHYLVVKWYLAYIAVMLYFKRADEIAKFLQVIRNPHRG